MAPEKFTNTWKKSSIVSPVSAEPGKGEPGPPVALPPIPNPPDTLNLLNPAQKTTTK